ncbi:MAG: SoxR reducing system RseC family protein [Actinobacteria bacterium]|nr:SoxR reducing system RseC family protein [Actinomycetota bacterium]
MEERGPYVENEGREQPELFDYSSVTRERREEGTVVEVSGDTARVLLRRSRLCEGCGSCCVLVDDKTMLAEAENGLGAKQGDRVLVDLPKGASIRAAYILYGIPLLAFLVGLGLGSLLGSAVSGGGVAVIMGLVFAFAFLVIAFILISRVYAPGSRASSRYRLSISKIL